MQSATKHISELPESVLVKIFTDSFAVWQKVVLAMGKLTMPIEIQMAARNKFLYTSKNRNGEYHYIILEDRCALHGVAIPAIRKRNYDELWYRFGMRHRENMYAIQYVKGQRFWYYKDKLHRNGADGPAAIFGDGNLEWREHGVLHRVGGPAKIYPDGMLEWYQNGVLHNDNGPARLYNDGSEERWIHGVRKELV